MQKDSPIADAIAELLSEEDWPHGRTLEQCLIDLEAVMQRMLSLLKHNERDVCVGYKTFDDSTGKGPP